MFVEPPTTPYPTIPSTSFSQVPGALPGDCVPQDVDLSLFPALAGETLRNLTSSSLAPDAIWRDFFALSGRLRTFNGSESITAALEAAGRGRTVGEWRMEDATVSRATPTSSWVDVRFAFSVAADEESRGKGQGEAGLKRNCSGIVSFVPALEREGGWKVWMLRTMLENFDGLGHPDDPSPIFSSLLPQAPNPSSEIFDFETVVIGAGQCGLSLAGRLGALGIKYLLLEKETCIGKSWTGKYDSVRQHTVREMNNLPFERTYDADDPILLPAKRVAEGFQNYATKYKINAWLGAATERCVRKDGGWELDVRIGKETWLVKTKHLVLALGGGVSVPVSPNVQGRSNFRGDVLDIVEYQNCRSWKGKKGIVVGSGTAAHDVAQDMLDAGLQAVTMIQRSRTPVFPVEWIIHGQSMLYNTEVPTEKADRLLSLMPLKISRELMRVNMGQLISANADRFDALEKSGFRVNREGLLADYLLLRGGGYYIDVGTSQRIADGDIRVKSGINISNFTQSGVRFEDGEEIEADLVVFATGYERDVRLQAAQIVGDEIASSLPQARVLNDEGEVSGPMTPGAECLWLMRGAVNDARFQSRFIALQIQAELLAKPLPDCQWGKQI